MAGQDLTQYKIKKYTLVVTPPPLAPTLPPEHVEKMNVARDGQFLYGAVNGTDIDLYFLHEYGVQEVGTRFLLLAENEVTKRNLAGFLLRAALPMGTRFVFQLED